MILTICLNRKQVKIASDEFRVDEILDPIRRILDEHEIEVDEIEMKEKRSIEQASFWCVNKCELTPDYEEYLEPCLVDIIDFLEE